MRRYRGTAAAAFVCVACVFGASDVADAQIKAQVAEGTTPAWDKGIQPINRDNYWNAVECGKQRGGSPACLYYDAGFCKNDDFVLTFFTPYKGVGFEVWQALKQGLPAPTPNYADAQRTRVTLGVTLAKGLKNAITSLAIKRGARVVKPATQSFNAGGGNFIFDFAAFAPTEDLTIEMVGKTRTLSCLVEKDVLLRLR